MWSWALSGVRYFLHTLSAAWQNISAAVTRWSSNYLIVRATVCLSLIYGLVSLVDLIYNEVSPLVKIWTWIMWHRSNYFFVRPRLLSTLTVCITNSCHWGFHLITIIWSIILDWPNHTSHHARHFIYHWADVPSSPKIVIGYSPKVQYWWFFEIGVFTTVFINFTPAM